MRNWPTRGREMIYTGDDGLLHLRYENIWADGRITISDTCLYLIPNSKEAKQYESDRKANRR